MSQPEKSRARERSVCSSRSYSSPPRAAVAASRPRRGQEEAGGRDHARRRHVGPVAPLTGLPDKTGASFRRPAVTVKINNTNAAKQYGVDQADVVYEEVVEGGYTRLAAIFNSHAPDRVGPVRSVRKTDQSIVWPIGGIFAYSGRRAVRDRQHQHRAREAARREPRRIDDVPRPHRVPGLVGVPYAPFNLWAHVDQMYKAGRQADPAAAVVRVPQAR